MKREYNRREGIRELEPGKIQALGTYSIVTKSPDSGLLGIAVASGSTSVGDRVPHAKPGVGVVATQAYTNILYATKGLKLIEQGTSPREALDLILREDSGRELRQVAMMDTEGNKAVFTGRKVPEWYGNSIGKDYIVIGNLLAGEEVVNRMAEEFERSVGALIWRMVKGLETASESGGDRRGERSAAIIVVSARNVEVEIRVNKHRTPIKELCRRLELHHHHSL